MRRGDTTPGFSAQKTTDLCSTFLPKKWYIVAKRRKRLQSGAITNAELTNYDLLFEGTYVLMSLNRLDF